MSISIENDPSKSHFLSVYDGFRRNYSLHHLEVTLSSRTCKYTASALTSVYKYIIVKVYSRSLGRA